jgi:hypothetical protein
MVVSAMCTSASVGIGAGSAAAVVARPVLVTLVKAPYTPGSFDDRDDQVFALALSVQHLAAVLSHWWAHRDSPTRSWRDGAPRASWVVTRVPAMGGAPQTRARRLAQARLRGALSNVGHEVGRATIKRILKEHGIDPAPTRGRGLSWATFIKAHLAAITAADFFTVEVVS